MTAASLPLFYVRPRVLQPALHGRRFKGLPDAEFLRWRAKGWLPLVYCHFISVGTWSTLVDQMFVA
jgi:hypothetical protein